MASVNEKECNSVGLNTKAVLKIANRLEGVMRDAKKMGVSLFCGGSNTLRFNDGHQQLLVVGHLGFQNADGGDGGCSEDPNGLLRGE